MAVLIRNPEEGAMEKTTVFKSNRTQAVRLPKAVAFPDDVRQVDIIAVGRARIIVPAGEAWDSWFDGPAVSADFMNDREQPDGQEREGF
ncbi:type II toxin-antitoxin system VapB family antitoxin [Alloalcanivorax profundimaris]